MSQLELRVDRSISVPLYSQIAQQLEDAVRSGVLVPGERLENEVALAERFGLSRPTLRQAIQQLVRKGLLVRRRGIGTQVVPGHGGSDITRRIGLSSLFDDLVREGRTPRTDVRSHQVLPADRQVAAKLGVREGTEVVKIERLRWAGEEPLALMCNWLPADVATFSSEQLAIHGLYELLRRSGVQMRIARQRIGARSATPAEAGLLHEREGAPLLTMQLTAYGDSGRAVELGSHAYRAEIYSLEVTLVEP